MADDVTIVIRADSGDAVRAFRDVDGRLRDMRGRFVSESSIMSGAMRKLSGSIGSLVPVATAAVPVAAALGVATLKAGSAAAGAGVAVAAFGVAVAGQVGAMSDAAKAQDKYNQAVFQYGQGSKQAAEAQRTVQATFEAMPTATARATVALSTLKGTFRDFSDSTASFTMVPVEKSFTVLGQVIPKLTPMAKGAASQLDRLVTVAGGAVASPGFDALADKFSTFANESLQDAVDGIIHFARVLSEGEASGPVQSFMEFAEANGPALQETLRNVGDAVMTLMEASAAAGPGMLTLVNAGLKLVAALPPELVATVMQLAVGLKLVTLAGAGAAAASTGIAALGAQITALRAASAAAGGGMAGLAAAFGTLGKAAKASIVVAGIGALVYAVSKLSDIGEKAPPNVDKLTTSLGKLGSSGKVTGEAAKAFGEDFGKLRDQINKVIDPSVTESINNWGADISQGLLDAGDATEEFNKSMDSIDQSLTNLVKGGKADLAKAALGEMLKGMSPEQADKFRSGLDGYRSALEDLKFEQELAAQSMGVFATAAQDTSAKLEAQKGAADGLRASILALNDVNRSAYDAQIGFEESLDSLTESFKEHGATLNLDTEAGRANGQAMSAAAAAQDEFIASGLAAGESLASMTQKSNELRETMMRLAVDAFDGNRQKATEYVNTLLGAPGEIKTLVKLEREEAITGLQEVQAEIQKTPDAKKVTVSTLNGAAIAALEAVGLKTKQLPDGRTAVYTANGQALGNISAVSTAMNNINGKVATTYVNSIVTTTKKSVHEVVGATGGLFTGKSFKRGYQDGGPVVGPGTGTSDDVFAPWLSNGEFVMRKAAVDRYGEKFMQLVNEGRLDMPKFASGGKVSQAQQQARNDLSRSFGISHFGSMAGYQTDPFSKSLGKPQDLGSLVSALNGLRGQIKAAFSGGKESSLLKSLDSAGKKLIAYEKQLTSVNKSLEKARDKLDSLKDAAAALDASVKGGIISGANITRAATAEEGQVTINTLLSQARGDAAQADAFADALKQLEKKGVSGRIIEQIAEAGITGGGLETAQALLGADKGQISELNKLNQSIRQSADDAGELAAESLYGAGIKAAEGLVAGLKKKKKDIEAAMLSIAKSMEKAIKEALGIKSPSTVMAKVGDQTAEGFALGMVRNRSVRPAWESMLNMPRPGAVRTTLPAGTGGGAGAGSTSVIQLQIGDTQLGEVIIDPLRKVITTRGGLKATFPRDFA